jgi:chromosome partitioning protein
MAVTFALVNAKGGVGKTSTCHHLAGTLAKAGRRVLLIDNDPQASLTQGLWGPEAMRGMARSASVAALYDADLEPIPEAVIRPSGFDNVWLVPGSEALTRYNQMPPESWGPSQGGLRCFLGEARGDFDIVLIDCAPNIHLCSWAALVAADGVVVPLQPEDYGSQGLTPIREAIAAVQAAANPALQLTGYLLTMYDKRLAIHLAYETRLRALYEEAVFAATFPLAKDYKEAVASRQPISHYKPRSAAAKAARAVADELLARAAALGWSDGAGGVGVEGRAVA